MALDADRLKNLIIDNLRACGFDTDGVHSRNIEMAKSVADAVVQHITESAEVPVQGGSSAGSYKVL